MEEIFLICGVEVRIQLAHNLNSKIIHSVVEEEDILVDEIVVEVEVLEAVAAEVAEQVVDMIVRKRVVTHRHKNRLVMIYVNFLIRKGL